MRIHALAVALIVLSSFASTANAQAEARLRTISLSGEAVVYVAPDEAVFRIGVEVYDASFTKARDETERRAAGLLAALRNAGIAVGDIQTEQLTIQIHYSNENRNGVTVRELIGYTATRMYIVSVKKLDTLDRAIDATLQNGANLLGGVEFRTSELRKHRDEARRLAARAAREKADLLTAELGAKVVKVLSISEQQSPGGWNRANFAQNSFQEVGGEAGADTIPGGKIAVRATVSASFEIE
jgi:uncharacterized protein